MTKILTLLNKMKPNSICFFITALVIQVHANAADNIPIAADSNQATPNKPQSSAGVNLDVTKKSVDPIAMNEDTYFENIPNVLTVSRLSQPIADAPSAVTVIDKETIRAAGIIDLPEVFRLVPGFYVGVNAGFIQNTNHVVSYHGMASAYPGNMQVLIDGRSVYEPLYGGVQWSEIPLAIQDIERIEVTRGPNAASYGANSFAGVINIITQNPNDAQGSRVSISAANGRNEQFYRYGGKTNDLSYRVTLGRREDTGLNNRSDYKRTNMLSARANYQINSRDELEFQFGAAEGLREEGAIDQFPFSLPHTKDIDNHFELVKWRRSFSASSDLQIQAYHSVSNAYETNLTGDLSIYNSRLLAFGFPPVLNPFQLLDGRMQIERFDLELQQTQAISEALRVVWGGNIRLDKTTSPFWLGKSDAQDFNLQRLFAQAEWHAAKNVVVNAGAMVEHNDFTGTDVSPRASVNFKLSPKQTIRLGISTATRTPNLLEEKFDNRIITPSVNPNITYVSSRYINQGNLEPETIVSKEIGYLADFGRVSIDARVFHDVINHLISQVRNNQVTLPTGFTFFPNTPRTFVNGGYLTIDGFETQAKWRVTPKTLLLANYAYVNINANDDINASEQVKSELKAEASMATTTISGLLSHHFNDSWDASLAYYQVGAVAALGDGSSVPLNRRWDARLAHKFSAGRWRGEVSGTVQNLLNDHYQEFAVYNTMRRRAYLNLTLEF